MRRIAFLLLLAICGAQPAFAAGAPAPAIKSIAVLDLVNRNAGDGFDWLGKGLADMLIADLTASKKLTVVDRERTQEVTRELELDRAGLIEAGASQVGEIANVDWVAFGSYSARADKLTVELLLLELDHQKILRIESVEGPLAQVPALEQSLVRSLLEQMKLPMTEQELRKVSRIKTNSLPAFEHYSRSLAMYDSGNWYEALTEARLARKADPAYLDAAQQTASLYHELGAEEHALVEYETLIAHDNDNSLPDSEYYRTAGLLDEVFHRRKDAIALLTRTLARYRDELPGFDVRQPSELFDHEQYGNRMQTIDAIGKTYRTFLMTLERLGRWHLEDKQEREAAKYYSWYTDFIWRHGMPYGTPQDRGLEHIVSQTYTPLYWRLVARDEDAGLRPPVTLWVVGADKPYTLTTKPSHGSAEIGDRTQKSCTWVAPPGQEIASVELVAKPSTIKADAPYAAPGTIQFDVGSMPRSLFVPYEDPNYIYGSHNIFAVTSEGTKRAVPIKPGARALHTSIFRTDQWELRFKLRPWSKVDLAKAAEPRLPSIWTIPSDGAITIDGTHQGANGVNFTFNSDTPARLPGEHIVTVRWPNGIVKSDKILAVEGKPDLTINARCESLGHAAIAPLGSHPCFLLDRQQKIWLVWDQDRSFDNTVAPSNDSDLYAATSTDGLTWSKPRRLPVSSSTVRDSKPHLQQDANGVFWLVWVAYRDQKKTLCIAQSSNGIAWSFPRRLVLPDAVRTQEFDWDQTPHACGFVIDRKGTFWMEWQSYLLRSKDGKAWEVDSVLNTNDRKDMNWGRSKTCVLAVDALDNLLLLCPTWTETPARMGATLWRRSEGDWQRLGRAIDGPNIPLHAGSVAAGRDNSILMAIGDGNGIIARQWRLTGKPLEPIQLLNHMYGAATPAILRLPDDKLLLSYASYEGIFVDALRIDEQPPMPVPDFQPALPVGGKFGGK